MYFIILFIIITVIILLFLFFYPAGILISPSTPQSLSNSVCIKGNCFQIELAKTELERETGLMSRSELDKNKGMLFIFDKDGIYPFWMKNTLIPLDMIWIDSNGKVVFIIQNVQPCKSLICPSVVPTGPSSGYPAKYVLEINAGISQNLGIKIGDTVELKIVN